MIPPDITHTAKMVGLSGIHEIIHEPLYFHRLIPVMDPGPIRVEFFDQSYGTATRGLVDTNLHIAGMLPGNHAFIVCGLAVLVNHSERRRWHHLAESGVMEFNIADRMMGTFRCSMLPLFQPGHTRTVTEEWTSRRITKIVKKVQITEGMLRLDPTIVIQPLRTFRVTMTFISPRPRPPWPMLIPTDPLGVTMILSGYRVRSVL